MATEANHLSTILTSKSFPILLRTIQPEDAPRHAALLDLEVAKSEVNIANQRKSADVPTVLNPDGTVASGPGRVNMVIVTTTASGAEDQLIGLGGYGQIQSLERDGRKIRAGDVGVLLQPEFRGKGYAFEALKLAIDWAFSPVSEGGPQLDLVTITTLEDNAPMVRIANEKMKLDGKGVVRPTGFDPSKNEVYWEFTAEDWKRMSA